MALPSRMGAFMVGAAFGSSQCFYWLREDVKHVGDAMDRKIEAISEEVCFTRCLNSIYDSIRIFNPITEGNRL